MASAADVYETLAVERDGGVLRITLNRPEVRNALNGAMIRELGALFEGASGDAVTRMIVLRGAGGTFCAGADIADLGAALGAPGAGPDPLAALSRRFGALLELVNAAPLVVIAVVEGAAMGGGLGLVCACDMVIAEAGARFGLPEVTLGLPPAQIAPFVVARIGLANSRRLALSGARFDGREAEALGLVNWACEGREALEEQVQTTIFEVHRCAPGAVAATKKLVLDAGTVALSELLDRAAGDFAHALRGPEGREGTAAFLEKRPPGWAAGE